MDNTFFNVLIGPFIIFTVVYLILSILCILRFFVMKKSSNSSKIGKIFYVGIFIVCLYRSITSALCTYLSIAFQRNASPMDISDFNIFFLNFLYIPDILIWNCFAFLYYQLIVFFYKGHLRMSYADFQNNNQNFQWNWFHVLFIFISLASAIQIIFTTLASTRTISITSFLIENAVFSFIIPFILVISEFKLHLTFSGLPYRSLFASENKGRINKIIIYWGFARTLHGVVDILLVTYRLESFNDLIPQSSDYGAFVLCVLFLIGEKIFTEIVPYLLVFDLDFMSVLFTFQKELGSDEQINNLNTENLIEKKFIMAEKININDEKYSFSSMEEFQVNCLPRININLIIFDKIEAMLMRERGLGILKIGNKDKNLKLGVRVIEIKKISKYIMEETFKDLSILSNLQNKCQDQIVKIKGFDFNLNENRIYIYYEYFPLGSLFSFLHKKDLGVFNNKKETFLKNFEEKFMFSLDLARTLSNFHSMGLIHGHLTSSNILLDRNFKPKVSDFFLNSLKKYAGIMTNYCNKTQYTAPEYFEDRGNVVLNCRKPADVYSFGIILWELFTEKEPFQGINLKNLAYLVGKEKSRPKIPEETPGEIANIIRVCWQHDEEKRPEFGALVKNMENFGYLNESEGY